MIEITLRTSLILALALSVVIIIIFLLLFFNNWSQKRTQLKYEQMKNHILNVLPTITDGKRDRFIEKNRELFLDIVIEIRQNLSSDQRVRESATRYVERHGFDNKYIRNLKRRKKLTRIEAASYLGNIQTEKSREALMKALAKERNPIVRIYIINALVNLGEQKAIPVIVKSLLDAPDWYQERVCSLLCAFQRDLHE